MRLTFHKTLFYDLESIRSAHTYVSKENIYRVGTQIIEFNNMKMNSGVEQDWNFNSRNEKKKKNEIIIHVICYLDCPVIKSNASFTFSLKA